ncbi:MAG: metallophosphoesterase [Candidatus Cloacimonetes bacterium 4572_55]|nr:MAG: metallophosphoesterase [Candidatus Cloacimonetes bacterium 4572_55]
MRVLIIGDIIGRPGRSLIARNLPKLQQEYEIDFTIANGENVAGGIGATRKTVEKLFSYGIDAITSGNHIWKYKEIETYIEEQPNLFRPINYPPGAPGRGAAILYVHGTIPIALINVMGRVFMRPLDCPFRTVDAVLKKLKQKTKIVIVDFHAEATSEKNAFGFHFDGQISAVIGTHTHVQTADERILPKGTAYITDVGMVGGRNSIIGSNAKNVIAGMIYGLPRKYEPEKNDVMINAVAVDIDERTGSARSIERISKSYPDPNNEKRDY